MARASKWFWSPVVDTAGCADVRRRHPGVALLCAASLLLSACGGGARDTAVETTADSVDVDSAARAAPRITLAEPEVAAGSHRITLRWSARGNAMSYSVLLQRSERDGFETIAQGLAGTTTLIERGPAWSLDFPTARIKVRGCVPSGQRCVDSNEQPLLAALTGGIVTLHSAHPDRTFDVNDPNGTLNVLPDYFSHHIALSTTGATLAATTRDRVYVFGRSGAGVWQAPTQVPGAGDWSAAPVQLSADGNTMVVVAGNESGAYGGINPAPGSGGGFFEAPFWGAVYVFVRDAQGQWQRQAHIRQDARQQFETFGASTSLSLDGNTLAVATRGGGPSRVYLFRRDGSTWRQDQVLATPAAPNFEQFSGPVALSGNGRVLAITGGGELDTSGFTAYRYVDVYTHASQTGWLRQARLRSKKPVFLDIDDEFGNGLALSEDGSTIAVAAPGDDADDRDTAGDPANRAAPLSGAVYVFRRTGGNAWPQQAFVKPRQAATNDDFGRRIALSRAGDVLIGSARGLAANAAGVNRNHEAGRTAATPPGSDGFGGAAYVFVAGSDGAWAERATAIPPVTGRTSYVFFALALSGDGRTYALGADAGQRVGDIVTFRARVYVY